MKILRFSIFRMLNIIPVLFTIILLTFFLLQMAGGDAATVLAGEAGSATPEYIAQLRSRFGLDEPLYVRLYLYLQNLALLNLGYSFRHEMLVLDLIIQRLGPTILLMGTSFAISVLLGSFLGILAATGRRTWRDWLISALAIVVYATPIFWIGLMLIVLFSVQLNILPSSGMENIIAFYEGWARIVDIAVHLTLPAVTLSLFYTAAYLRLMRASFLDQSSMDYATTARSKGATEHRITFIHVLPNALLPVVTVAGVQLGAMLGGSVIVESVFGWPGIGSLAYEALFSRDINLLLGIFLVSSCMVVFANMLVDTLYIFLDPRIGK